MKGGLLWCVVLAAVVAGVVQAQETDTKVNTTAATPADTTKSSIDITTEEITDRNSEVLPSDADGKTSDNPEVTVAPSEDQVAEGVVDNDDDDDDDDVVESKVEDDMEEEYVEDGEILEEEEEAEEMRVQPESPSSEGQSVPEGGSDAPPQLTLSVPAMIGGVLMVLRLNL